MRISLVIPRWPKDSFWDVIASKFPLLGLTLVVLFPINILDFSPSQIYTVA